MIDYQVIEGRPLDSPARVEPSVRGVVRVGVVQTYWREDVVQHAAALSDGVRIAADRGATIVCLQELTLAPYFAVSPNAADAARWRERIPDGPTTTLATTLARETGAYVHASVYEQPDGAGLGFNTAICVAPDGTLVARTRKLHIPRFPGYHEDHYFEPGDTGFPVVEVTGARVGFPTCWDQWFPEVARIYSLAGADVLVYPTAIGSEPHLDGFDTQPLWQQMITANGLANATFMIAVNRIGREHGLEFYGSSFVSDPYGRTIAQAPRDTPAVLVCDLDLDQRRDWLGFGLLSTRRPDQYTPLLAADPAPQPTPTEAPR
ncbi:MAG: nitrilase-related carbon-nitrogen hydrolase [Solirubrobacterales bacterium]